MKFDFLGQLIGKAARRRLEQEVAAGGGPVMNAVLPLLIDQAIQGKDALLNTAVAAGLAEHQAAQAATTPKGN